MLNYQKHLPLSGITFLVYGCLLAFWASAGQAADLQIEHFPLRCMTTGAPAVIMAQVSAETTIEAARLYFRAQGRSNGWYVIRLQSENAQEFSGLLPAPQPGVEKVLYHILFADQTGQAVKSPLFTVRVTDDAATCPQNSPDKLPRELLIFAESPLAPEKGFSADYLVWKSDEKDVRIHPYLKQAREIQAMPPSVKTGAPSKKFRIGKKTAIGLGAGAGAIAAIGLAVSGGGDSDSLWGSLDNVTKSVVAELVKMPEIQTSCGTLVTNRLFVTNTQANDITLGNIEYEIVLTTDDPKGSCAPGRSGAFAPNLATVIPPGETLLIREWANEVNPCSGCPYPVAECVWKSRYVLHTSGGNAVAYGSFAIEGNLCGSSLKLAPQGAQLRGDCEP